MATKDVAIPANLSGIARDGKLLFSLYETGLAIVSTLKVKEILNLVVEHTRLLTEAEKAVLILKNPRARRTKLDTDSMVVRGQRDLYPEAWWKAEIERVADDVFKTGRPVFLTCGRDHESCSLVCIPLSVKGKNIGILLSLNSRFKRLDRDDIMVLTILASHAASAIENVRLYERAQRLVAANEKNRMAREIHDSVCQALFGIMLGLESCLSLLPGQPEQAESKLADLKRLASESLSALRESILTLRDEARDNLSLSTKFRHQVEEFNHASRLSAKFISLGDERPLPLDVEKSMCRFLEEALTNVAKHAAATQVLVKLKFDEEKAHLIVRDNGKSFDVEKVFSREGTCPEPLDSARDKLRRRKREKMGLQSIKERAETLGGSLKILSSPGYGTKLEITIPA